MHSLSKAQHCAALSPDSDLVNNYRSPLRDEELRTKQELKMSDKLNTREKSEEMGNETMLLTELFQKAFFLEPDSDLSPMEYLERYGSSIRATGRVLALLGLAEPIERNVIGWKPRPRLISLLAKPGAGPLKATRKWGSHTDLALVELLLLEHVPAH
jgi:hypothetical protein